MSDQKNNEKRSRATNFSLSEKELLLKFALENSNILENKKSNSVSWKDKNNCWLKIAEKYNSTTTGCPRDATSLRLKYEGIKKLIRGSKSELFKTGGGPHKELYTISSEMEKTLYDTIQISIEGLPSLFDNDAPESGNIQENGYELIDIIDDKGESIEVCEESAGCFRETFETYETSATEISQHPKVQEKHNNSIKYQPSTSNNYFTNTQSWTPLDSTKLLKSAAKHTKLTTNNQKKKKCQASASEKFMLLADKKLELVELQMSFLKKDNEENSSFLREKHALELKSLELDIEIKKQKLEKL